MLSLRLVRRLALLMAVGLVSLAALPAALISGARFHELKRQQPRQ